MDCVLAPTKAAVLTELKKHGKGGLPAEPYLRRASKASFYNTSPMDLKAIAGDPANVAGNLASYAHNGVVRVRCKVTLDADMNPTGMEIYEVQLGQAELFPCRTEPAIEA